ncbi:uncharacterized protein TNCV_2310331 [Trichonephila clavipes]|nr:uncharacterized protein TNCV_2310331 [Trichonephila clavipes]
MTVKNFVVRRSPFPSDRICQYIELPNIGNRESTRNSTSTTSSCKDHCGVRVYVIIYHRAILFDEIGAFGPFTVTISGQCYECLLRNHVIPGLQQLGCVDGIIFLCKMVLLRTLKIQ